MRMTAMAHKTYQILQLKRCGKIIQVKLLSLVSQQIVQGEICYDLNAWLLKLCGEKEYHIISGYCDADVSIDNTFTNDEAIVIGEDGIRNNMSDICKPMESYSDFIKAIYLCVAI